MSAQAPSAGDPWARSLGAWPDCFEWAMNCLRRGCACRSAQPDVLLRQSAPSMSLLMECLAWHQQVDEGCCDLFAVSGGGALIRHLLHSACICWPAEALSAIFRKRGWDCASSLGRNHPDAPFYMLTFSRKQSFTDLKAVRHSFRLFSFGICNCPARLSKFCRAAAVLALCGD